MNKQGKKWQLQAENINTDPLSGGCDKNLCKVFK
jgi:hypothetical protein